jgi:hypothetical protein
VPYGTNQLHSKPFHIITRSETIQNFNITVVAGGSAKVEQPK